MQNQQTVQVPAPRPRVDSAQGLSAEFTTNGSAARLEAFGHSLLLYPAGELEAGPANLHLRVHDGEHASWTPLLGPLSNGVVETGDGVVRVHGTWSDLDWAVTFRAGAGDTSAAPEAGAPAHASWRWDVEVENTGAREVVVDVVLTHDPALAPPGAVATNEYYVAQYLDVSPLATCRGTALAVRQNMPGTSVPWLVLGSLRRGTGWATDALQVVERTPEGTRWSGLDRASLPATRVQHEHTLVVLQDEPAPLAPGATHRTGFVGLVLADHPEATDAADSRWLDLAVAETRPSPAAVALSGGVPVVPTLLGGAPTVASRPLTADELDTLGIAPVTDVETSPTGEPWAWSTGEHHVVTAAKELAVLRPHGHLLRTGSTLSPDTHCLTTTVWMEGTFLSQVTRGHVGRDPLLTGRRSYLGLHRAHGARILLDTDEGPRLLGTPSAWRVGLDGCTWFYVVDDLVLEVGTGAPAERDELTLTVRVRAGRPRPFLVALATAGERELATSASSLTVGGVDGWRVDWDGADTTVGDDAVLHADHTSRDASWVTLAVGATRVWHLRIAAGLDVAREEDADHRAPFWDSAARNLDLTAADAPADRAELLAPIRSALPWFAHDALVHYLSPRGLEQYTGGGWGTRDVCQGPVGLLTALDRQDVVRELLGRVFRAQNARGDWPQAFEFLPPLPTSGQQDSHGDVVFWPLLATGEHLLASGEADLLEVVLPLVDDTGLTEPLRVADHLARALDRIEAGTVEGSPLPAYGHGDWNDSLQPADPHLASNLVSVWTSVLQTQALRTLAAGLRAVGAEPALGERAAALADATEDAIHHELITDDVLPGYVLHHDDGTREPLVHPRDQRTGLTLGILPWVHAVSADLLTSEQAEHHLALIEEHLLGPDGARLFDRPVGYAGGPMSVFQRAEASTFWGREIGLMYLHAHLRYAEALARVGRGEQLLRALAIATPRGAVDLVGPARPRQSTTYFSSSDGAFTDRYDAQDRYPELMAGEVPLEGGWRVYSSGPGLFLRLVVEVFLGVRRRGTAVELDPVVDPALGELRATVPFDGGTLDVLVRPGRAGHGVTRVTSRGADLATTGLDNPYRHGGVRVQLDDLRRAVAGRTAGDDRPDVIVETR
ncbi:cellobiose phosphorylase [Oryzobacter telluris]|uniref:cellobiose phosphorylase n=1 Tax=Oryzobacter telluris TaxID=3149179 RepID=UPI00370DB20E